MTTGGSRGTRTSGWLGRVLVAAWALLLAGPGRAEEPAAYVGALSPAGGHVVVQAGGGIVFTVPYGTAAGRVGLGAGLHGELALDVIGVLGAGADLAVAWGGWVSDRLALGLAARTGIGTLALADGLLGIVFSNFDIGNDWTAAIEVELTRIEAGRASVSGAVAADFTLADRRYSSFDESGFVIDPGFRGISFGLQGEWALEQGRHLFIRLDGSIPFHTSITPIGFLPTGTAGVAWHL